MDLKDIKIGFVSMSDPDNFNAYSGTQASDYIVLRKRFPNLTSVRPYLPGESLVYRWFYKRFIRGFLGYKTYIWRSSLLHALLCAQGLRKILRNESFDLLFICRGPAMLAFLKTDVPTMIEVDATPRLLVSEYPEAARLNRLSKLEWFCVYRLAIRKASAILCLSNWARESIVADYGVEDKKIALITRGPCFRKSSQRNENPVEMDTNGRCRLLFVGVAWERKGGNLVYEAFLELLKMGLDVELTISGLREAPPIPPHDLITVVPFVTKNTDEGEKFLKELYMTHHFLVVPTRAEALGSVFIEAMSFGLPSITTRVGGVPVEDGVSGYALPLDADGKRYASIISEVYRDPARYKRLRTSAYAAHTSQYNWTQWLNTFEEKIRELYPQAR